MKISEITGSKLKRNLGAKRTLKSYHNKHVDGSGNFGFVVVFDEVGSLTGERWLRIDGDYSPTGEVTRLSAGPYAEAGHPVSPIEYQKLIQVLKETGRTDSTAEGVKASYSEVAGPKTEKTDRRRDILRKCLKKAGYGVHPGAVLEKGVARERWEPEPEAVRRADEWIRSKAPKMIYERIYDKLVNVVPLELIKNKVSSGKSVLGGAFMDLNYDYLREDKDSNPIIALSQYYKHPSGDMIADPDMEIRVMLNQKMAEAMTYQDIYTYNQVYMDDKVDLRMKVKLNRFLNHWLGNLIRQGHKITI